MFTLLTLPATSVSFSPSPTLIFDYCESPFSEENDSSHSTSYDSIRYGSLAYTEFVFCEEYGNRFHAMIIHVCTNLCVNT